MMLFMMISHDDVAPQFKMSLTPPVQDSVSLWAVDTPSALLWRRHRNKAPARFRRRCGGVENGTTRTRPSFAGGGRCWTGEWVLGEPAGVGGGGTTCH